MPIKRRRMRDREFAGTRSMRTTPAEPSDQLRRILQLASPPIFAARFFASVTLKSDPALPKRLGASGRAYVETNFDRNTLAAEYLVNLERISA